VPVTLESTVCARPTIEAMIPTHIVINKSLPGTVRISPTPYGVAGGLKP